MFYFSFSEFTLIFTLYLPCPQIQIDTNCRKPTFSNILFAILGHITSWITINKIQYCFDSIKELIPISPIWWI